jgi:Holliday junction resolvase RusA-like endonuclease
VTISVTIELAGEVRGKANHTTRGGISYISGATRDYLAKLAYAAKQEMAGREPTLLPCRVEIDVYVAAPANPKGGKAARAAMLAGQSRPTKKPDLDNYYKTVGDALNGVVWVDDAQIVTTRIRKWWAEHPRLVVTAATIEQSAPREARPDPVDRVAELLP